MRGAQCGTLYKMLRITVIDGCNNLLIPKSENEEIKVPNLSRGDTMPWHKRLGHMGEKGLQSLQGKGMPEDILIAKQILIFVNIICMVRRIE